MCRLVFWVGILCLRIVVAQADTIPCYDSLKLQLHEQSLPLVNLMVDIDHVSKPTYTPAFVEICDPLKRMGGDGVTLLACKVKYRGNTSIRYDKKSFTIQVVDGQGEELNANLFGLRRDKTWVLDAMAVDRIRMRNRVNFDVWNAMSRVPYDTELDRRNGTVGLFVELFINGEYHGLYCFTDKVNRKLLDLKKPRVDDKGQPIIRGVLYKGREWSSATRLRGYETDTTWQKSGTDGNSHILRIILAKRLICPWCGSSTIAQNRRMSNCRRTSPSGFIWITFAITWFSCFRRAYSTISLRTLTLVWWTRAKATACSLPLGISTARLVAVGMVVIIPIQFGKDLSSPQSCPDAYGRVMWRVSKALYTTVGKRFAKLCCRRRRSADGSMPTPACLRSREHGNASMQSGMAIQCL